VSEIRGRMFEMNSVILLILSLGGSACKARKAIHVEREDRKLAPPNAASIAVGTFDDISPALLQIYE